MSREGSRKLRVLMICMGNICRSPTAEGVLRHKLREAGLDGLVEVDSAGTGNWHVGSPPDARAQRHARSRGYDLSSLRARQVKLRDFERFDFVLVMDDENLADVLEICPPEHRTRVLPLMNHATRSASLIVPDPYAGGPEDFEVVLDYIEDACDGLVAHISQRLRKPAP
ncbi:MAG TPA: low molecular weight protein-tyrosine-phosphatase [Burkholderiaceae bacterium]|nr:low molecular weight protein-tyrosine-phosphatase [Burkholderiaceae bacterium]